MEILKAALALDSNEPEVLNFEKVMRPEGDFFWDKNKAGWKGIKEHSGFLLKSARALAEKKRKNTLTRKNLDDWREGNPLRNILEAMLEGALILQSIYTEDLPKVFYFVELDIVTAPLRKIIIVTTRTDMPKPSGLDTQLFIVESFEKPIRILMAGAPIMKDVRVIKPGKYRTRDISEYDITVQNTEDTITITPLIQ
jgi:hypothetical protein